MSSLDFKNSLPLRLFIFSFDGDFFLRAIKEMTTVPLSHTNMYSKYVQHPSMFNDAPNYRGVNNSRFPIMMVVAVLILIAMLAFTFKNKTGLLASSCPSKRGVKELTSKKQLIDFINSDSETVVMYYAPWCGHCADAKPEFEKAAETSANMAMINADPSPGANILTSKDLQDLSVEGFPTVVKYAPGGNGSEIHQGSRTNESFSEFANN